MGNSISDQRKRELPESLKLTRDLLKYLRNRERLYFELLREKGATYKEIGDKLGMTKQSIHVRFKRKETK